MSHILFLIRYALIFPLGQSPTVVFCRFVGWIAVNRVGMNLLPTRPLFTGRYWARLVG